MNQQQAYQKIGRLEKLLYRTAQQLLETRQALETFQVTRCEYRDDQMVPSGTCQRDGWIEIGAEGSPEVIYCREHALAGLKNWEDGCSLIEYEVTVRYLITCFECGRPVVGLTGEGEWEDPTMPDGLNYSGYVCAPCDPAYRAYLATRTRR